MPSSSIDFFGINEKPNEKNDHVKNQMCTHFSIQAQMQHSNHYFPKKKKSYKI